MSKKQRFIGAVIYEGPSVIDQSPIVVIVTGFQKSANSKTGAMLQTWIMRADMSPAEAIQAGADSSVCGECPQRRNLGGSCYVVVEQAPLSVWKTWKRGRYADWTKAFPANALQGWTVRMGSYGDPGAVPYNVWRRVRDQKIDGSTCYTHQWRVRPDLRLFSMASVDSEEEMREAQELGWRTFRARHADDAYDRKVEVQCPAEVTTCSKCQLCEGRKKLAKSVTIVAHGYLAKRRLPVAV